MIIIIFNCNGENNLIRTIICLKVWKFRNWRWRRLKREYFKEFEVLLMLDLMIDKGANFAHFWRGYGYLILFTPFLRRYKKKNFKSCVQKIRRTWGENAWLWHVKVIIRQLKVPYLTPFFLENCSKHSFQFLNHLTNLNDIWPKYGLNVRKLS